MTVRAAITATGSALPARVLSNTDLEKTVETSDAWIVERTGIRERRVAGPDESAASLAELACRRALEQRGVDPASVDLIVAGTSSADHAFPSCATVVQGRLRIPHAFALDVNAACAGSVYALSVAERYVVSGMARRALVIGVDLLASRLVDWRDRGTCILFGDAAGALLLEPADDGRGVLSTHLASDGATDILYCATGGKIAMKGREVFKVAVRRLEESAREALSRAGATVGDVKAVFAHQANLRILTALMERLGLGMDKCPVNIERYGNTSAASVPLLLDEHHRAGRLQKGDLLLLSAIGGGMAWGSMVVRW